MSTAEEVKSCCADAYASAAARWLLGDRLHPGGAALTSRLAAALRADSGSVVADVACGPGAAAVQVVRETGARVVGVDLAADNVRRAREAARAAGLQARVSFVQGDAERLPLGDASMDGVLCECAFCTFPDKPTAAAELARVLKPGARLALSDMTAEPAALPPELTTVEAWVACVGDARPLDQISALLTRAGLQIERSEHHDQELAELLHRVEGRLRLARFVSSGVDGLSAAAERGLELVAAARRALGDGALGYASLVARRIA